MCDRVAVRAPGRVNLIGDHTDYTAGLVLPMAIDRWTTVTGTRTGGTMHLVSADGDPAAYVEAVAAELGDAALGIDGVITSTVPIGAGLSSSAALEVATALALGFLGPPLELARLCQRAEHRATGVATGIMDQLAVAAGFAGHALLIDCTTLAVTPVPLPGDIEIVVVDSGRRRALVGSAYAERAAQCAVAEAVVGPLARATLADVDRIDDAVIRRRARHVVSENARVRAFAAAMARGDAEQAGRLMQASHASLRDDFEVSTPELDALVARVASRPGVFGARLTGAGFGGCVVALTRPGAVPEGGVVHAVDGASSETA
ncbi:MAG TPA: galactokinase family protein [Acidimicrobiales bacterium]|nr:galactokinase family protein [Acidimicrobiales bacterium]